MRRVLLSVLVLAASAAPASASPPAEEPCAVAVQSGQRVVASSPQAVVTATPPPRDEEYFGTVYEGCLRESGRRTRLAEDLYGEKESSALGDLVLAGEWVVFQTDDYDAYSAGESRRRLWLGDLRSGFVQGVTSSARPFPAVRLDADGALAWLADDAITGERGVVAIVGGRPQLLDRGPAGAIEGLDLVEGRARWTTAGRPRERDIRPLCRPRLGEDVVLRSVEAVVLRVASSGLVHRGCLTADGRSTTLTATERPVRLAALALAAARVVRVDRFARTDRLHLTDLATGSRRTIATVRAPRRRVVAAAVTPAGAVAWLERLRRGDRRSYTLLARTSSGRRLVLDRGLPRPTPLSFTADRLHWVGRRGGRSRQVG